MNKYYIRIHGNRVFENVILAEYYDFNRTSINFFNKVDGNWILVYSCPANLSEIYKIEKVDE